jgi:hypothetical protein
VNRCRLCGARIPTWRDTCRRCFVRHLPRAFELWGAVFDDLDADGDPLQRALDGGDTQEPEADDDADERS